jgi:hypothetical protein
VNELEDDIEVIDDSSEDVDELEDVRYVSGDLEEERDDEFVNVCDKLLELEITGKLVSTCFQRPTRLTHM